MSFMEASGYMLKRIDRIRHSQVQIKQATADRDEQVLKASKRLDFVEEPRIRRAQLASHQRRVDDMMVTLAKLRKDNDKSAFNLFFIPIDVVLTSPCYQNAIVFES